MIESILSAVGFAAALSVAAVSAYWGLRRRRSGQVNVMANLFNLSLEGNTARGTWNGLPMEVSIQEIGDKLGQIKLRVGGADPRLRLTQEPFRLFGKRPPPPGPFLPPFMKAAYLEPDDIATGDEAFDAQILVKAPPGLGVGMLDRETRRLIQSVCELGCQVADGWITLELLRRPRADDDIAAWLRLMAELAQALTRRGRAPMVDNLLDNFNAERDPEVRRVNLACLGAYFPDDPRALEASRTALTDPGSDWISLQGAVNLRREGWPALRALVDDPGRLDGVRAAALRALALSLPPDEAEPLLLAYLDSPEPGLALSAVETLGETGRTTALAVRLDRWAGGRMEKADTRIGREAAAKVRQRLTGAEPGRLSLEEPGDEEGRLSRPEGERPKD